LDKSDNALELIVGKPVKRLVRDFFKMPGQERCQLEVGFRPVDPHRLNHARAMLDPVGVKVCNECLTDVVVRPAPAATLAWQKAAFPIGQQPAERAFKQFIPIRRGDIHHVRPLLPLMIERAAWMQQEAKSCGPRHSIVSSAAFNSQFWRMTLYR
jgi:hypothetical protein